jgi:hypothetical protein
VDNKRQEELTVNMVRSSSIVSREVGDELDETIIVGDLETTEHIILEIGLIFWVSIYKGLNASIDTLPHS